MAQKAPMDDHKSIVDAIRAKKSAPKEPEQAPEEDLLEAELPPEEPEESEADKLKKRIRELLG